MNEEIRPRPESWLGSVIDKKYRLLSPLGSGGMALVFLAERLHLRDMVAIKVLQPRAHSSSDALRRFQIEAAAAAKVKHPNVVTIYDFGFTDNGVVYIVMELLEGPGLDDELRRLGRFSIERTLEILKPVCSAIDAAHSLGLLHRDIKPPNIILHRGRYDISEVVKVLDFGIAKFFESDELVVRTSEGIVLGTAEYMSPEQCQGLPLDRRTDVYSLAMVCYHMLSGRLPFTAGETTEFLIKHVNEQPLPLRRAYNEISPEIEAIVMSALAKEPDERPASALEFYQRLDTAFNEMNTSQFSAVLAPLPAAHIPTVNLTKEITPTASMSAELGPAPAKFNCFVGRNTELSHLIDAWHAACAGEGRPLILLGEPGIGKTRLLEEFCNRVIETGAFVLRGRFYEMPGVRSFQTMILDLKNFLTRMQSRTEEMQATFGARADVLMRQLSRIWRTGGLVDHLSSWSDQETRLEYFSTLAQAFSLLSRRRPVLLALDDLHWADESARELLAYMVRSMSRERLLIVATGRPVGDNENFKEWLKNFRRECEVLTLSHFNRQQAFEVLEAIFGQVAITERQFKSLLEKSGGNPYFLVEILRLLMAEEHVKFDGEQWVFYNLNINIPPALIDFVELTLERIAKEARRIFTIAAVIGEEFNMDLLQHLTKLDEEALQGAIDRGIESSLVSPLPGRDCYRFNNTTIRRVLYDSLNKRARRRLHRFIAEWLETCRADIAIFQLAYHYYEAGELSSAFRQAVLAADAARESLQIDELRKYLGWAEESLAGLAELRQLEAAALVGELPTQAEAHEQVGLLANFRWLCGLSLVYRGRGDRAEEPLQQALAQAHLLNNSRLLGQIYTTLGVSRVNSGNKGEAIDFYKQALECYRQADYLDGQAHTLRNMSIIYEQRGDYTLALDCTQAAVETARACGNRGLESFSLSSEGWMLCKLRRFEEAALVVKKALELARRTAYQAARCACYNTVAEIYADQGLYQEAIKPRREALRIARALGNRHFELIITNNLGELYLNLDKYQEAENYFLKALKLLQSGTNQLFEQVTLHNLVRVCVKLKKMPQARAYLSRAETLNTTVDLLEQRCEFRMVMAELFFMDGKNREAIIEADQAITFARTLGSLEHEWLPLLIKARALIALSRLAQAKETLAKCIATIERGAETIADIPVRERYLAHSERQLAYQLYTQIATDGAPATLT
ncbi:MAG: protein kinase [Acidobacteriota bacterium]